MIHINILVLCCFFYIEARKSYYNNNLHRGPRTEFYKNTVGDVGDSPLLKIYQLFYVEKTSLYMFLVYFGISMTFAPSQMWLLFIKKYTPLYCCTAKWYGVIKEHTLVKRLLNVICVITLLHSIMLWWGTKEHILVKSLSNVMPMITLINTMLIS